MAAETKRIKIGNTDGQGGANVYDAAVGELWTLLKSGPLNLVIKFSKESPSVEIYQGATGLPNAKTAVGMLCDWDDGSLSIALLTGNSVYYRSSSLPTQFVYSCDA